MAACPGPVLDASPAFADTERTDTVNRVLWLTCIERHNALRYCVIQHNEAQ